MKEIKMLVIQPKPKGYLYEQLKQYVEDENVQKIVATS